MTIMTFAAALAINPGAAPAAPGCPWAALPKPDPNVNLIPIAELTIGGIGLQTPVFQGWLPDIETEASRALNRGPAFYPPRMVYPNGRLNHLPGQGGTVGMLGHRTTRTHPFCLSASIHPGSYAVIGTQYKTLVYREVAQIVVLRSNWTAFERPEKYDPHPKAWDKGIKPEYLVLGTCDPPHRAVKVINTIFKLVKVSRA